jgi:glutamate racemase
MTKNAPIAFIDSGVGGLPYLKWVKDKLPLENFFYLADSGNFPYGEKTEKELVPIVLDAVKNL